MGLDYRFHVVFPVGAAEAALGALARELAADDRVRLLAALPWQAANARVTSWRGSALWERSGILSLARRDHDRSEAFCFKLKVAVDEALVAVESARGEAFPREEPAALIDCWVSMASGARLSVISATPVAHEVRPLCEASPTFHAPWQRTASAARAHALFLDTKPESPRRLLYPETRDVSRPDCTEFELSDHSVATDGYWTDSLQRAGIDLPPLSSPPRPQLDPAQNET